MSVFLRRSDNRAHQEVFGRLTVPGFAPLSLASGLGPGEIGKAMVCQAFMHSPHGIIVGTIHNVENMENYVGIGTHSLTKKCYFWNINPLLPIGIWKHMAKPMFT